MEDWMHFEVMLTDVFQQPLPYPFPFGSNDLNWLYEASDETLRRLSYPRLRDQAVSVFGVFEEFKGRYWALWHVAEAQGLTPYLDQEIRGVSHLLHIRRSVLIMASATPFCSCTT